MFELLLGIAGKLDYSIKPLPSQPELGIYNTATVLGDNPGEVWIFAGVTRRQTVSRSSWLYNAETDTLEGPWLIPIERTIRNTTSIGKIGNMIYFIDADLITSFNTTTKTFALIAGLAYGSVYNFYGNGSVTYQGNLYYFGPSSKGDTGMTLKRYNHTNNTWSTTASYTTTGTGAVYNKGVIVGTAAYFIGGNGHTDKIIKYDFATNQFTLLPINRHIGNFSGLAVKDGYIYTSLMGDPGQAPAVVAYDGKYIGKYEVATNVLSVAANIVPSRLSTVLSITSDKLYLVGGQTKSPITPVPTTYVVNL